MKDYCSTEYIILAALILFVSMWVTLYSFNPYYVQVISECDLYPRAGACPDPIKCYIYSFLAAFAILVVVGVVSRFM